MLSRLPVAMIPRATGNYLPDFMFYIEYEVSELMLIVINANTSVVYAAIVSLSFQWKYICGIKRSPHLEMLAWVYFFMLFPHHMHTVDEDIYFFKP